MHPHSPAPNSRGSSPSGPYHGGQGLPGAGLRTPLEHSLEQQWVLGDALVGLDEEVPQRLPPRALVLLTPLPGKVGRGQGAASHPPAPPQGYPQPWSKVRRIPLPQQPLSHLHEGVEERVVVLLLPGVGHGLLHSQAVQDVGLEALAELEGQVWGGERAGEGAWPRSLVQLPPIPTPHHFQPPSLDSKEELRFRGADPLPPSELHPQPLPRPTALDLTRHQ